MIPKGKCLTIDTESNIVILENLDVYEIYIPKHNKLTILVRKLPMKATINFNEYYGDGDDSKANWTNPYVPISEEEGLLHWDY